MRGVASAKGCRSCGAGVADVDRCCRCPRKAQLHSVDFETFGSESALDDRRQAMFILTNRIFTSVPTRRASPVAV